MGAPAAAAAEPDTRDFGYPQDAVLNGRYRIVGAAPLATFHTPTAHAFKVEDLNGSGFDAYALVDESELPPRIDMIAELRALDHRHLVRLIDAGTVSLTGPGQANSAVVLERPLGGRLMPDQGARPMSEQAVRQEVMAPVLGVLTTLHKHGLIHRAVHPRNLFLADAARKHLVLGECVSSVAGQNQPAAFEPLERASAPPLGRGAGDGAADVYAFGVTIAALLTGRIPGDGIEPRDLLDARMDLGSMTALCGGFRFSREVQRLLAGMLADAPSERWSLADIEQWLLGEHVTGVVIQRPDRPKKPFPFCDREYRNTVAVAEAFNRNWSEAALEIESGRREAWLASDRDRLVLAESVMILREGQATSANKSSGDVLISRVCMVLDRDGPIRFKGVSVSIDAIGSLLAGAFLAGNTDLANTIAALLGLGVPLAWIGAIDDRRKLHASTTAKFTRLRQYVGKPTLGYGLERCLYELNPALRCLCAQVEPAAAGDAAALLVALDDLGPASGEDAPWIDRHIAAFIAAALHPRSDARLAATALPADPAAAQNLIGLVLFAVAQGRLGVARLPNLTRAAAPSIPDFVASFHARGTRTKLLAALDRLLGAGDLAALVKQLTDDKIQARDQREYGAAASGYTTADAEIAMLQTNIAQRRAKAVSLGRQIAAWIAYLGLVATLATVFSGLTI